LPRPPRSASNFFPPSFAPGDSDLSPLSPFSSHFERRRTNFQHDAVAHLSLLCHPTGTRARSLSISTSRIYASPTGPWHSSTSWTRSPASSSMSACPKRTSHRSATASRCPLAGFEYGVQCCMSLTSIYPAPSNQRIPNSSSVCGNNLVQGAVVAPESECNMGCGGLTTSVSFFTFCTADSSVTNSSEACGGPNRVSVYNSTSSVTALAVPIMQTTNLPGNW
jgi:hypothetical protein